MSSLLGDAQLAALEQDDDPTGALEPRWEGSGSESGEPAALDAEVDTLMHAVPPPGWVLPLATEEDTAAMEMID